MKKFLSSILKAGMAESSMQNSFSSRRNDQNQAQKPYLDKVKQAKYCYEPDSACTSNQISFNEDDFPPLGQGDYLSNLINFFTCLIKIFYLLKLLNRPNQTQSRLQNLLQFKTITRVIPILDQKVNAKFLI